MRYHARSICLSASKILQANNTRMSYCNVKQAKDGQDLRRKGRPPSPRKQAFISWRHSRHYSNIHPFPIHLVDLCSPFTSLCKETTPVPVLHVPRGRGSASTARERGIPTSGHTQCSLFSFRIDMAHHGIELPKMCRKYWDTASNF